MAISDRLQQIQTRCPFARVLDCLPDDDRLAVIDYVNGIIEEWRINPRAPRKSANQLWQVLKAEGYNVGVESVRNHINGRCGCRKTS